MMNFGIHSCDCGGEERERGEKRKEKGEEVKV
jgi:hypothetical protein